MDRRKFLSMLGLAPVALAASKLPSVSASSAPPVRYANGGVIPQPMSRMLTGESGPEMMVPLRKVTTVIDINTKMNERELIKLLKRYHRKGGNV